MIGIDFILTVILECSCDNSLIPHVEKMLTLPFTSVRLLSKATLCCLGAYDTSFVILKQEELSLLKQMLSAFSGTSTSFSIFKQLEVINQLTKSPINAQLLYEHGCGTLLEQTLTHDTSHEVEEAIAETIQNMFSPSKAETNLTSKICKFCVCVCMWE